MVESHGLGRTEMSEYIEYVFVCCICIYYIRITFTCGMHCVHVLFMYMYTHLYVPPRAIMVVGSHGLGRIEMSEYVENVFIIYMYITYTSYVRV